MDRSVFGRKQNPPSERELHGQLLIAAADLFETVVGQVNTLPGLKREYPDRWPEILDIDAIQAGIEDAGAQLKTFSEWMANNAGPMPPKAVELLADLVRMLQNSKTIIADNLADILMDKMMKEAIRNSRSEIE
ncbi:hypothetical protein OK349_06520 [Sphingomonas sp. BT-65]|uniref:hypothetical protein n=1 Tax=Sphingomonas sp. BT-65 TaxID=2989821 RepID=UPI0022364013|nr:hypothetical protein [Sphingomonas sp. BT-65]MCW4461355.1 hypothetical protein [Sphingomonas sp. BT-65]